MATYQSYPPSLWAPPAPPPAPTLTSTAPSAGVISTPYTLNCIGTNFTATSVVWWNGAAVTTTYVSATNITAAVTTPGTAGSVNVLVKDGAQSSNIRIFTVSAT